MDEESGTYQISKSILKEESRISTVMVVVHTSACTCHRTFPRESIYMTVTQEPHPQLEED